MRRMIQNDSKPLFSESHPQWLTIKGDAEGIEVGDVVRTLWKCFARKVKPGEKKICVVREVSKYEDGTVAILPMYLSERNEFVAIAGKGKVEGTTFYI